VTAGDRRRCEIVQDGFDPICRRAMNPDLRRLLYISDNRIVFAVPCRSSLVPVRVTIAGPTGQRLDYIIRKLNSKA